MNANIIAHTILSWDTDEELSDEEEIYSGAVGDEEVVLPANIGIDSDSSKGESDDDLNPQPTSSLQALRVLVGQRWHFAEMLRSSKQ